MSQGLRDPKDSPSGQPSQGSGGITAPPASSGPVLLRVGNTAIMESEDTLSPDEPPSAEREKARALPIVDPKSYRISGEVAQGGIGRILRARDERLDRPVALKELRTSAGSVAEDRFVREALLTARLQHPSIVPLYEAGRWPTGEPFYAMKYVAGRSLLDVIQERTALEQRLGLLPHVLAVAEAMAYAHSERIIHRDLKPANILVGDFGETVVIDWGLAKHLSEEQRDSAASKEERRSTPTEAIAPTSEPGPVSALTMHGAVMGTPAYMPLEQATGKRVDERADVYALGAILYNLLAGACPYDGDTSATILRKVIAGPPAPIESRQKGIPEDLLAIVKKAMARDPDLRYPSAKEFADDLRRFQTGQIVAAHKYSRMERARRFVLRHRAAVASFTSALVVLLMIGGFAVRHNITQRRRAEMGEAAALDAKMDALEHADDMTLVQARAAAERDPNEAIAWLKSLSSAFNRWPEARLIAADANARGLATVLRGHEGTVNDTAFSPDGTRLLTVSDDHTARLWDVHTGHGHVLLGHTDEVWVERFSPSGHLVLTGSKDKTIRLWDGRTGAPRGVLEGSTTEVTNLEFLDEETVIASDLRRSVWLWDLPAGKGRILLPRGLWRGSPLSADRRRAALFGEDGAIYIYDRGLDQVKALPGTQANVVAIALSWDGKTVLGRSRDGSMRKWDVETGKVQLLTEPLKRGIVAGLREGIALSPDGKLLAMAGEGSIVRLWDLTTFADRVLDDHPAPITSVAFSPDGKLLAAGSRDHTVRLWDIARGVSTILRGFDDSVVTLAFSPDGSLLAAASEDHTVRLFSLKAVSHQIAFDHGSPSRALAFSPDGARLVMGGDSGQAHLFDVASRKSTPLLGHARRILSATFSPNGELVASTDADGITRIWDLSGHEVWTAEGGARQSPVTPPMWARVPPGQPVFSPDSRLLAALGKANDVQIMDIDTGMLSSLVGHEKPLQCVAFSPDGRTLASSSIDGSIRVWDLASAQGRTFSGHQGRVMALAFSPDGRTLASGGEDHSLRLWNVATGDGRKFDAGGMGIVQINFSSDGALLITRDLDESSVRLWDAPTGEPRGLLRGHSGTVRHFSLSPDDARIATASADGTARIWDLKSGESRVLAGHRGEVWATTFSPDGKRIASTGEDGTVRLWADDLPEDGPAIRAWIAAATPDTIDLYRHAARTSRKQPGR